MPNANAGAPDELRRLRHAHGDALTTRKTALAMPRQLRPSAKKKRRKLDSQNRLPKSSGGLNVAAGSSTERKPPDQTVTYFRS